MLRTTFRLLLALPVTLALAVAAPSADAEVKSKIIEYKDGDTTLKGLLAWDDAKSGPQPAVLVVHEWWGLNDYAKSRALALAKEGYVAFALDMYGDDKVTNHPEQASAWSSEITANVAAWRARADKGLEVLKSQPNVDGANVAAIGYCFGGSTVMQMAYGGSDVKAVASFHGSLPPAPESVTEIKPRVFVAHGRADSFIPKEQVLAFQDGLDRANANWEMTIYSGARHAFTNPDAGQYGIENIAYDEAADKHSWAAMLELFDNTLR